LPGKPLNNRHRSVQVGQWKELRLSPVPRLSKMAEAALSCEYRR
jgi:hypothetical protein